MKRFAPLFFLLLLLTISVVSARTDIGGEDITVYKIESVSGFSQPFAIVLPKATFAPGETMPITIGSNVPCNTKTAVLTISSSSGGQLYYKDVSSLVYPCSTSYVKITFSAPATAGDYTIGVTFKDSTGKELYTDSTIFRVVKPNDPVTCPSGYCTSWTDTQRFEFGRIQQKTCYLYAATSCDQSQVQSYRTVCDTGFVLVNNVCVKPNNVATCGDGVVQSGEACDYGDENGVCPSQCNLLCSLSRCEELPDMVDPPNPPGKDGELPLTKIFFGLGIALLIIGVVWWTQKK